VEAEGSKPVNVTVEVNLTLTPEAKGVDVQALVKEATNEAHKASENYLRRLK
jgi:post-segregation antitoxin (ccd killing protein)